MYDVFRRLPAGESREQMLHWVVVCLPNFAQATPQPLAQWLLSCVLLASVRSAPLESLLLDLLAQRDTHVHAEVLTMAVLAFMADDDLLDDDRTALLALLHTHSDTQPAFRDALLLLSEDE